MSSTRTRTATYRPRRPSSKSRSAQQHPSTTIYHRSINVDKNHIGYLIGPKGSVIKGLQQKYGIRSRIDQKKQVYILSGGEKNVTEAIVEIQNHIEWINNVSSKREQALSSSEQLEEDGWTSVGPRRKSKNQPRRMVEKAKSVQFSSVNFFAELDEDDEGDTASTEKRDGKVPSVSIVAQPIGCWASGVTAEVKENGTMKMSRSMLQQRLSDARSELANAEMKLSDELKVNTGSSWADAADIEEFEDDVVHWKGVVEDLRAAISKC